MYKNIFEKSSLCTNVACLEKNGCTDDAADKINEMQLKQDLNRANLENVYLISKRN